MPSTIPHRAGANARGNVIGLPVVHLFRRGGTAPLSIFVGRVAMSLISDSLAATVLQLHRGLKSRSLAVARSAQDESKSGTC